MDLRDRRILVTGGNGFLGKHLRQALKQRGCSSVTAPTRVQCDLMRQEDVARLFLETRPQVVFHLAGSVGGIGASRANPGSTFYENLLMGALVVDQSRLSSVEKFVGIGTICSYPEKTPVPFREQVLWDGYPEPFHAPYGLAKKLLLVQGQAYRKQYGFKAIHLMPVNLYGPGDHFDPETSPVVPALIRRFSDAARGGQPEVTCWGDGSATREFLYVGDCAEAILLAAERYDGADPVNIGTGVETTVRELAGIIAELCGFRGKILWNSSQPAGQARRWLDVSLAKKTFGFTARMPLKEGLQTTVSWYGQNMVGASLP